MPARLAPMHLIFSPIFEWIGRAGRHVQSRLVLGLVTIAAFDGEDALPVSDTPQAEEGVRATIVTLQRRISRRVAIEAPCMHQDLVRFQKGRPSARVIA